MKILHITTHFSPFVGGLENLVFDLATEQAKTHEVSVLTLQYEKKLLKKETSNGINIIRHPCFSLLKNRYVIPQKNFCNGLAKTPPDIIFTHTRFFLTSFLGGYWVKKKHPKTKWIHVEHGQNFVRSTSFFVVFGARFFDFFFGKWIFKKADKVVVLSEKGSSFAQKLGASKEKIVIIPNGVKIPQKTTPIPRKNKALFFGRIVAEKGLFEILDAAKNCPCWHFEIVGNSNKKNTKPTSNVTFSPAVPHAQILQKIQAADLVLLPSYSEGASLAVLESAACSRAIIATPVGQNKKIVSPEFLVPLQSAQAIEKKLKQLENNWETLEIEGKKNQHKVDSSFSFKHMISQYEQVLELNKFKIT